MSRAGLLPSLALSALLVSATTALVFGINAVLRPGCSLLPVAPSTVESVSQPATLEQACAVLGRPLPRPAILPSGARMTQIAIDGPPPAGFDCCRIVHVSYATNGKNFASLAVQRQNAIPRGNVGQINATLAGVPAIIEQTRRPTLDA